MKTLRIKPVLPTMHVKYCQIYFIYDKLIKRTLNIYSMSDTSEEAAIHCCKMIPYSHYLSYFLQAV